MSMNKKILSTIVPIFTISIGIYLIYEIFRTQSSYQKDFDDSIETSMTILGPALISNIYNLEKFAAQISIKGIFANANIESAIAFTEDKTFFAGIRKNKQNDFEEIKEKVNIDDYVENFDLLKKKEFYVDSDSLNGRIFVYPLWSAAANGKQETLSGIFVIEASTEALKNRMFQMVIRLIIGLSISLVLAIIFTYIFLQFQIIKPIVRLMQASLDIAAGKYTKLPAPKDRNSDELAMLTNNFNFMVNKIEINLNLIRGISEASQEIVRCKTFNEIHEVYFKHSIKLVQAGEVDIWVSSKGQPTEDAKHFKRVHDNQILKENYPILEKVTVEREVIPIEPNVNKNHKKGFCVPLINGGGILVGLAEVYFESDKHNYGEEEIQIAHGLGISATTAIENCWRIAEEKEKANMERDLELASAVQDSIVSKNIPKNPNYDVATYYKTAGQCGGDWFGAYEVGTNKLLILFGDVTGHGTPAALITAVTRGSADMLRHFITESNKAITDSSLPAKVLQYLNECIYGTGRQTYFMTMVAALIDFNAKKIYASSAGHTPPIFITITETNSSAKYFYPKGGNRLGFNKDSTYEGQEFSFLPGQQVVFYTDGIIEGENKAGKEYGMKKFKQSLEIHGSLYPENLVKNISNDAFKYFDGVSPKDDIAILAVRFLTEQEQAERNLDIINYEKVA